MAPYLLKLFKFNWILLAATLSLCVLGVVSIYSATFMRDVGPLHLIYRKQVTWVALSLAAFLVVSLLDYRWIRWGALPVYILGVGLLVLTKFKGKTVFGAKSWLQVGGISLQPSQVAILGGIMVIALLLTEGRRLHPALKVLLCGVIAAPPALLVAIQPQLGGVLVWGPVVLAMLFVGGVPVRYILAIVLLVAAVMPVAAHVALKEFQYNRLTAFIDPDNDPQGTGWTIIQSQTAIGSGGFNGKGFRARNTLVEQGMLPQTISHTDFIFAVVGETFGFVGNASILGIFALLILTGLYVAYQSQDQLGLLLTVGIMALLFTHVFMNAGMTVRLVPIAGLPLPLISYGGTFALIVLSALGIVQSVWLHRKALR